MQWKGDSFNGGLLYSLTRRNNLLDVTKEKLEESIYFANCVAALCVTKKEGIPALPFLDDVLALQKHL